MLKYKWLGIPTKILMHMWVFVCLSFSDCKGVQWRCEKDESHWGADQHWENARIQVKGTKRQKSNDSL